MYNVFVEYSVNNKTVKLKQDQEYIKLQSLLQIADIISNGGEAKIFLSENEVLVNGEPEERRGRKLYEGDIVTVLGTTIKVIK